MRIWMHEARLLLRQRLAAFALVLIALLSSGALIAGLVEIERQRDAIAAIAVAQAEDIGAVAAFVDRSKDAGSAAYYSFHPTWDAPSPLAFAAIGMRDVAPYILRVRALGLEAQIYDGDTFNPELALPGRFDFAFVLVFLAPLFVIALFHDLVSGEREAGRARMLQALPGAHGRLWLRRSALRFVLLSAALGLPFAVAALATGVTVGLVLAVLGIAAAYLLFWILLTALVGALRWSSVANAATLAAGWLVLALVLPTMSHVLINRAIPVGEGAEIALAQRERVNGAWDIPRGETMRLFYAGHPQWADSPPLTDDFHYKWYFAFHQVGDESVAPQVLAYRDGIARRQQAGRTLGWVLPPVGVQTLLARLANTDIDAQLAYQDRIRAYHARLRDFYYGYLFRDRPFTKEDFARAPAYGG
ncbi:ABC-2 type transport system permease protein [Sphingomonas zeicaulis]|uniref:ABC transporter permease n=1 Tax=Sphingomonas zeicaulis TaxID=1632740 RepID=UPI003D203670